MADQMSQNIIPDVLEIRNIGAVTAAQRLIAGYCYQESVLSFDVAGLEIGEAWGFIGRRG